VEYISLFSGIEAATVAWHDLGWTPVAFADIDEFPSALLKHHYPHVPNLGDVTGVDWNEWKGKAKCVVGGSPCQSFSLAGKRLGMDDPRGNLALHYLGVVRDIQPKWFVYENVVGLLSSGGGADFATFLSEVAKLGYGFAYRVLDAQNFGVPQRRRRVFVVGCADGDWRSAAAVLFESESLVRDSKQGGSKGQKNTLFTKDSPGDKSEDPSSDTGRGIDSNPLKPAGSLTAGMYHHGSINNQCLGTNGHLIMEEKKLVHCAEVAPTLTSSGPPYSRTGNSRVESDALAVMDGRGVDIWNNKLTGHVASTMGTNTGIAIDNGPMVFDDYESQLLVRRLMPAECERLQGFPEGYTLIPWKGKEASRCPSTHRYKALGNSMAVPVMKWIGERIDMVDSIDLTNRGIPKAMVQTTLW
tara:strand:+ start:15443 stop:16681 length:1239 start_codon:yes stop_codon:yes gene_type:complete